LGEPDEPGSFAGSGQPCRHRWVAGSPRRPSLDRTAGFLAGGSLPCAAFPGRGCPHPSGVPA